MAKKSSRAKKTGGGSRTSSGRTGTTRKSAKKKAGSKKKTASRSAARTTRKTTAKKSAPKKSATSDSKKTSKKSPFNKRELDSFRKMLLEKRHELTGDMFGIESGALRRNRQDGTGDLSSMPTHPADVGSDNYEQEFTLGLLQSERQMLAEIDEALDRIEAGVFGLCLGTGKPIGAARLKARPWAKHCIEYARLVEKGIVRPGEEIDLDEDDDDEDEDED